MRLKSKFSLLIGTLCTVMLAPAIALADEAPAAAEAAAQAAASAISEPAIKAIAAALAIAIAVVFGAIGQAKIGTSALDGIARNPGASGKMFVPMLLGMAFVESLVLYAFLIALMIR